MGAVGGRGGGGCTYHMVQQFEDVIRETGDNMCFIYVHINIIWGPGCTADFLKSFRSADLFREVERSEDIKSVQMNKPFSWTPLYLDSKCFWPPPLSWAFFRSSDLYYLFWKTLTLIMPWLLIFFTYGVISRQRINRQ